jgi:hypothetical protein
VIFLKRKLELDKMYACLGKKGSGKTNLLANQIQGIKQMCPIYIADSVGNFGAGGEFNRKEFLLMDGKQYTVKDLHKPYVFVKYIDTEDKWIQFNKDILSLYEGNNHTQHCYIVFDELYLNVDKFNLDSEKNADFKKILIAGRNFGIGILISAQRSGIMNKTVLSQCNAIYCFRLFETNDLKAIQDYFDTDKISALKDYYFLGYFPDIDKKNVEFSPIGYIGNNPSK